MESVASPELAGSLDGAAQESSVASLELATGVQIRVPHKQKDKFITVEATDVGYWLNLIKSRVHALDNNNAKKTTLSVQELKKTKHGK